MWHETFNQLLESCFLDLKSRNKRFSKRAFARKLGISSGMLSDVNKGKARFTKERALEILNKLDLKAQDRAHMVVQLGAPGELVQDIPDTRDFSVIYDYKYRAILFAYDIEKFAVTPAYLSEKLNLAVGEIEHRIANLLDLGLLLKQPDGKIVRSKVIWQTPTKTSKEVVYDYYRKNIELIEKSITQVAPEKRDYTTITFAGNSKQLAELRKEIQALYERTLAVMETPETDDVYQMSVFIHPILSAGLK